VALFLGSHGNQSMNVLDKLAAALNRRDEAPNQELAKKILRTKDQRAVKTLVENLFQANQNIQGDCIKVLYEIGYQNPSLIAPYYKEFGKLLDNKTNRLVWGAMTALDSIAETEPKGVHSLLGKILIVADSGSVITRDHAVGILAKLGTMKEYANECVPLLIEQLRNCPDNQFGMYAEKSEAVVTEKNKQSFVDVIMRRLTTVEKESQRKRIAKILKRLAK
jgi:HEAT repeat protein